jgi:hypothetical protein
MTGIKNSEEFKIRVKEIAGNPGITWNLDIPGAFNPRMMCIRIEKKHTRKIKYGKHTRKIKYGIQRNKSSEE